MAIKTDEEIESTKKHQFQAYPRSKKRLERSPTKPRRKSKRKIRQRYEKSPMSFKDPYGDDAEAVMYATATKMAKKNA